MNAAAKYASGTRLTVGSHDVIIDKYISEGGFAHVYTAFVSPRPACGELCCLKRVAVPDKTYLNLLRAEVDAMQQLKGMSNVVQYIDSHAERMKPPATGYEVFLLMEYCAGGGLIDFMNTRLKDQLREHEILKIMYDISVAVAHMHYLTPPLLHRDIKIENVLLTNNDTYKLCDFGSVSVVLRPANTPQELHILDEDIQHHTTLVYRSPEMMNLYLGLPIDEKSDIWALGVFLYKLCYYITPFEKEGEQAIKSASYTIPHKPAYSSRLKNVIRVLLQANPSLRPNIYQLVQEVSNMRGVECPIPDIYSRQSHPQPQSHPKVRAQPLQVGQERQETQRQYEQQPHKEPERVPYKEPKPAQPPYEEIPPKPPKPHASPFQVHPRVQPGGGPPVQAVPAPGQVPVSVPTPAAPPAQIKPAPKSAPSTPYVAPSVPATTYAAPGSSALNVAPSTPSHERSFSAKFPALAGPPIAPVEADLSGSDDETGPFASDLEDQASIESAELHTRFPSVEEISGLYPVSPGLQTEIAQAVPPLISLEEPADRARAVRERAQAQILAARQEGDRNSKMLSDLESSEDSLDADRSHINSNVDFLRTLDSEGRVQRHHNHHGHGRRPSWFNRGAATRRSSSQHQSDYNGSESEPQESERGPRNEYPARNNSESPDVFKRSSFTPSNSIQQRVRAFLVEQEAPTSVRRTAQGYGRYTDSAHASGDESHKTEAKSKLMASRSVPSLLLLSNKETVGVSRSNTLEGKRRPSVPSKSSKPRKE